MNPHKGALPIPLPVRVLLLGSGELGRELTISLKRLGVEVIAADSYDNAPAMQVADGSRVFDMTDDDALREAIASVKPDLVVPEVEAIATNVLVDVEQQGSMRIVPNAFSVATTMDRQRIRDLVSNIDGVRTSRFFFASSAQEVRNAVNDVGLPAFIKPTMSSSGHGQSRITDLTQVDDAWDTAYTGARAETGRVIVEESVDFDSEITLLTVRWWDGIADCIRTSFCDPIGHRQVDGDYVESWQPAHISTKAIESAHEMAQKVTDALAEHGGDPCLGLFGVEFFIRGDKVWFSELSPRPHDTGMVTMVTQHQSEFDLHARAILGLPVDTVMVSPGASSVIKSPEESEVVQYLGIDKALALGGEVRIFGKQATHKGRRMGVALASHSDVDQARDQVSHMVSKVKLVGHNNS